MEDSRIPYSKALSFLKEETTFSEKLYLSGEKIESLRKRLDQLMEEQKPFLRHHYTINDLARDLGLPAYQVSAFVNQILHQRYNDLINHYRITYCLRLLRTHAKPDLKVNKLAASCGYSNRNTFISAFKRVTQSTPFSYLSQLKKDNGK